MKTCSRCGVVLVDRLFLPDGSHSGCKNPPHVFEDHERVLHDEMRSSMRGVIIFAATAIVGYIGFFESIRPHPNWRVYCEVDGCLGVGMLSTTMLIRFVCDYFERRDQYRLEVCKHVHDS
jgi:hypothetical protein